MWVARAVKSKAEGLSIETLISVLWFQAADGPFSPCACVQMKPHSKPYGNQ